MRERSPFTKAVLTGAVVGLVVVVIGAVLFVLGDGSGLPASSDVPDEVMLICVAPDADGALVAGSIALLDAQCTVRVVDAFSEVDIPGTSYSQLRDAYAFGGGEAVATAYASAEGMPGPPEWIVLGPETWQAIVDAQGGISIEVPDAVNIYMHDEFFSIDQGEQILSGGEAAAFMATESAKDSGSIEPTQATLGEALAGAMCDGWVEVLAAIESGDAPSSVEPSALSGFAGQPQG